ncbi:hypothetical protein RRG08_016623 [Elysia crispata]|uniref:Uncharacterized protein n=1 Tax=Elysia crispata TaxID=231223 RepID=A0AAE0XPN9_9GAST|nr:hypothetical protein RRG08_016623 [Elysia crispata]
MVINVTRVYLNTGRHTEASQIKTSQKNLRTNGDMLIRSFAALNSVTPRTIRMMFTCDEVKRDQVILESIRTQLLKISGRSRSSKQQVSSPDHQQTYLYVDQSIPRWHNRHGADLDLLTPGKTNRLLESETFPGEELDVILSWLHSDLLEDGEALDLEVWTPFPVSVDRQLGMLATGLMKTVVVSFPCTRGPG